MTALPEPIDEQPRTDARPWHAMEASDVLARAQTTPEGLSSAEVAARLAVHGPNRLERRVADSPLKILWRQIGTPLDNPLIWVLLGASLLAVALGKVTDGLVVLAVVVLNTLIGFIQERRASRAIEALASMVPEHATVQRDGHSVTVPVADLVPGDIITLAAGDEVPADARLLQVRNFDVEEAALTGESMPVSKRVAPVPATAPLGDRVCMVFSGTLVSSGTATAVVTATGTATELGRISTLIEEATPLETPLTRALASLGRVITVAILVLAVAMGVVGTVRATAQGMGMGEALRDMLVFAIALAVGAIPEGLPAIVTIALAIGVQRMAARRAIIRKLPAVETLGSTTVICSDKTGTLTRNQMTVVALWIPADDSADVSPDDSAESPDGLYQLTGTGYEPAGQLVRDGQPVAEPPVDVARLACDFALCSDASLHRGDDGWQTSGDPTEVALIVAAEKLGVRVEVMRRAHPRLDAIPFESEQQFMATLHETPSGGRRIVLKGAPEVVLARCGAGVHGRAQGSELGGDLDRDRVLATVERLAAGGMRVLAVATRDADAGKERLDLADTREGFVLLGLAGMIDPPRPEAVEAVRTCQAAGIVVKMITGDHRITAEAIGREVGVLGGGQARIGAELEVDDARLREVARETHVFARVAPEHKLRLVRALQADGQVVAMTGDGVNDAPALEQADIGVAMGITGTAVSREAADIVLADDNFSSIAAAVEEGRRVYDNLVKSLAFVLPTNLGLAFVLVSAVLFFPFSAATGEMLLPMQPTQILWINLVAAVGLALPLAFEAKEPGLMQRPPRDPRAPVLSRFVVWRTVVVALLMTAGAVGLFVVDYADALAAGMAPAIALAEAQTMAVTTIIMFQVFYLLSCRSLHGSLLRIGVFSNPIVFLGIGAILLLQAAFIYAPPLQAVFDTSALSGREIVISIVVGALILPVAGVQKWLEQRRARRASRRRRG